MVYCQALPRNRYVPVLSPDSIQMCRTDLSVWQFATTDHVSLPRLYLQRKQSARTLDVQSISVNGILEVSVKREEHTPTCMCSTAYTWLYLPFPARFDPYDTRPDAYACEVKVKDERLDEATIEQSYTDEEEATANEQKETDGNSAGGPVASAESSVQPQVSSQEVDAPVPVAPPVSRRPARRSQGRSVGGACVAHRTRARSGRPFAHRVAGVRATRSRVRAGEAYLVAGIE